MWTAEIDGMLIRPVLSVKRPTPDRPYWVIKTPMHTYTASDRCRVIITVDKTNAPKYVKTINSK